MALFVAQGKRSWNPKGGASKTYLWPCYVNLCQNMHLEEGNYTVVELRIQEKLKEATKSARESMGVRPQARA